MHIGPFFITPELTLDRLGIDNSVVDSNGDVGKDFVVGVTPAATVWLPLANRLLITTTLQNGFWYYKRHPAQSSLDPAVGVKGELRLGPLVPFASRLFDQSRRRPNAETDIRVPLTTVTTQVGFAYQPQSRSSFEISASQADSSYGADAQYAGIRISTAADKVVRGVKLRVDRKLSSFTAVHVSFENIQERFKLSTIRDSDGVQALIGAEFGRRALVFGSAEIGYRTMKMPSAVVPSFTGLVANASLTRQFRGASALTVGWSRGVDNSLILEHPYFASNDVGVKMRQQLWRSFDGIAAFQTRSSSYVKGPSDLTSPRVRTRTASLDFGFRLNHGARLGVLVASSRVWSDVAILRPYSGLRVGLSFSVGF